MISMRRGFIPSPNPLPPNLLANGNARGGNREKQYKTRIKAWGLEKKVKKCEMLAIIRKREERRQRGKESLFFVRGLPVEGQKIDRFLRSHAQDPVVESPPRMYFFQFLAFPSLGCGCADQGYSYSVGR
jgi:hypothetical protein